MVCVFGDEGDKVTTEAPRGSSLAVPRGTCACDTVSSNTLDTGHVSAAELYGVLVGE